jgi:hypothetical protein
MLTKNHIQLNLTYANKWKRRKEGSISMKMLLLKWKENNQEDQIRKNIEMRGRKWEEIK